ncbi:MAG: glycerophosphodiester phosphodiesterase [Verrucomicrobiales bacterium]|nr:glycerophosphodiester phosphodiesterase [Verrucomicrobiota bacterium JB025]
MKFAIIPLAVASLLSASAAPVIVAHRGASHDAPENTLPSFKLAWRKHADAIEGDFYLTDDGRIVCIHDKDTKRVAGKKLTISESPLATLRTLDVGSWKGARWKGTTAPTLDEVLACVPAGKRILIEVKCGPEIIPAMLREIKASGLADDQVTVIAFDADVIAALKKQTNAYQAYWLTSFKKRGSLNPGTDRILKTLKRINADGVSTKADPRITPQFVRAIKNAGYSYHVWTVDDASDAKRFETLGVDSITTNRPAFIRNALAR